MADGGFKRKLTAIISADVEISTRPFSSKIPNLRLLPNGYPWFKITINTEAASNEEDQNIRRIIKIGQDASGKKMVEYYV